MKFQELEIRELWDKMRSQRVNSSYPFHIPIVRDTEAPEVKEEPGHDPATELPPDGLVSCLKDMLLSDFGVKRVPLLSTAHIGSLALSSTKESFDAFINLGTGMTPNCRYGQSPMLLEMLGAPYSGNNPFTMLLCRDKARTKNFASSLGIRTPEGIFVESSTINLLNSIDSSLLPVFIKPNYRGNSLGISDALIHSKEELLISAGQLLENYPDGILVERFIHGLEATVLSFVSRKKIYHVSLVMAGKSGEDLPVEFFRSHHSKLHNERHDCEWFLMQDRTMQAARECEAMSSRLISSLGLRDLVRTDFRISTEGIPFFIECNTQAELDEKVGYVSRLNETYFKSPSGLQWLFLATTLDRMLRCM